MPLLVAIFLMKTSCLAMNRAYWSSAVILLMTAACNSRQAQDPYATWAVYLGDHASSQYSSLDQINRRNVASLEIAWTYAAGDADSTGRTQIQCNPIVIDGVLYGVSPRVKIFALNAATGEPHWVFDPFTAGAVAEGPSILRGVSYWEGDKAHRPRILFTAGARLFAVDAATGQPIQSFGDSGSVDLRKGLGRDVTGLSVGARTPGVIYNTLLIQGTNVSEGPMSAPGHIRAYDVRSGAMEWIFHTIPHPGEPGYDTWPEDAYERAGGANAWTGLSLDKERGIVYLPTGSAAFDFWGGNRKGQNLYANSLLALDAATGKRIWHYQTVHHDLWDRDLPSPPNLVTVERGGASVDAVVIATKSGFVFVFDRETGEPLFPIEERSFPPSDLLGEATWPTQPIPLAPPPFARQYFGSEDITDISPEATAYVAEILRTVRSDGQFVPPSTQGTVIYPGFDGGAEWGGSAYDPVTGLLYVNSNEMPWILTMVELNPYDAATGSGLYARYCAGCHGSQLEGNTDLSSPALTGLADRFSRHEVADQVARGKGYMPSFGFLSAAEVTSITSFLYGEEDATVSAVDEQSIQLSTSFAGSPYGHTGYNRFFDEEGYPAVKPPWGTLNAIDLSAGEFVWTVPLGEFDELTARGIPVTGTENYGGPVVTAGGLLFIAASKDERFRALDKDTGVVLWEVQLPAGGYATPATYQVDERQYVVIAAGGGKMGTKSGNTYIAFALPG